MAALQGLLTGATIVFLSRSCNEAQQRRQSIIWEKLTLELNHILLLLGTVLKQMQVIASPIALITRTVFVLTPALLAIALNNNGVSSRNSAEFADTCNKIYTVAAFVISLQMLVFGNFWVGALSLATIVCGFSAQQRNVSPIFTALATLAFFGFTAQIFLGASLLNKVIIVLTAGLIFIPKIYNWLFPAPVIAPENERERAEERRDNPTHAQPPPAAGPTPACPVYYAPPPVFVRPTPTAPVYYAPPPPPVVVVMPSGSRETARQEQKEATPLAHRPIYGSGATPTFAPAAPVPRVFGSEQRRAATAALGTEETHRATRPSFGGGGSAFSPGVGFGQTARASRDAGGNPFSAAPLFEGRPSARGGQGRR